MTRWRGPRMPHSARRWGASALERRLVEFAARETGRLGDLGGRLLESNPGCREGAYLRERVGEGDGGGLGAGHHDDDLPAGAVGEALRELGEGSAGDLLVQFGELAAHRGAALGAERRREIRERIRDAVRRLEEDDRAGLGGERAEGGEAALARQEALEAEAVG